ncbi:MAG: mannose-6-phosphate isomerase, class I [Sphaerochaetaceae bacterium]|nr:mannose-6-phosphate isomerase, class I [Sphaerochaetaceae bacterium]
MDIVKITPQMKAFLWGSTSYIQQLVGAPANGSPVGELWMGTHPNAPSLVPSAANRTLGDFLSMNRQYLGSLEQLPFLFKLMAIEKPLSIQCHPTKAQAVEGYALEAKKRTRVTNEFWNYQDSNQKAEMLYAITPTTAMCGFRPWIAAKEDLNKLLGPLYQRFFGNCDNHANPMQAFFHSLYRLDPADLVLCIQKYAASLSAWGPMFDGQYLTPAGIAINAIAEYPADPGVFAPFFLNVIQLHPGEAIYLEPRIVHAYVKGNGIELMNNSDNVLRAGLTSKHMDVDELERVMLACEYPVKKLKPEIDESGVHFKTPSPDFYLSVMRNGTFSIKHASIEILFCLEGSATITVEDEQMQLLQGECAVVASDVKAYGLACVGTVFSASLPPH